MKVSRALLACLMVALAGCHSQPKITANSAAPQPAVNALIEQARANLPKNWTVTYDRESQTLDIERNRPVLTSRYAINASPDDLHRPPSFEKPQFGFRVVPYLNPDVWKARQADLKERMSALEKQISPRQGKEGFSAELYAHTAAEKPLVEAYNLALQELGSLPQYRYLDIGLKIYWPTGNFAPFDDVVNEADSAECMRVYQEFLKLLHAYDTGAIVSATGTR